MAAEDQAQDDEGSSESGDSSDQDGNSDDSSDLSVNLSQMMVSAQDDSAREQLTNRAGIPAKATKGSSVSRNIFLRAKRPGAKVIFEAE